MDDLIEAARRGDAAEIVRLLAQGVAVDARDDATRRSGSAVGNASVCRPGNAPG
jgi:hypothetical protein